MITLSGVSPAPGEKLVSLDTTVEFTLVDDGSGIDISTLIILITGTRVVEGTNFKPGYDGPLSSITPSGDDFIVSIDPETSFAIGSVIDVKIQAQTFDGKYFNTTYSFKILPEEPILIDSSPKEKDILTSPQVLFLEFDDIIDGVAESTLTVAINGLNYIEDGSFVLDYNGGLSTISKNGTSIAVRIDPDEPLKNGPYTLSYEVADTLGNYLRGDIKFEVDKPEEVLPDIFPQIEFLGYFQGIKRVSDVGSIDSLYIEWNKPIKRHYNKDAFVIVYEDEYRLNVFDNPKYLAIENVESATVSGLTPGKTLSYAARALEISSGIFDLNGMTQVDDGFYRIPDKVEVAATFDADDLVLQVTSTEGFPDAGILVIGREAVRYTSVDRIGNSFLIPPNGRGLLGSIPSVYLIGDSVELFLRCTDTNTVIIMATPTHHDGYGLDRYIDGEGLLITDYSDNDDRFFSGYDFCGWHDDRPIDALSGKNDCGSYLGGEVDGFRGFDLYDRMLGREEVLLNTTGEPAILLKRIWSGTTCSCMDPRKMSPKVKSCQECYGTGYVNGYTQFLNLRRNDRRIQVSFDETPEDLMHGEKEHLQQDFEPSAWTLPIPAIRDRDLIVRFDFTNDIEFIYEVLNVSREKIFDRKFGRQKLALKRLDKTDIVYTYPLDLSNTNLNA